MVGAVAVAACVGIQGCASIVGESRYPVSVSSAPTGASFEITDKNGELVHSGNTPSTVTLKSGKGYFSGQTYTLHFKKEGYPDKKIELDSSLSGWYWGNILIGGLIGMLIVDPLTGAMYKLPEQASADMGKPVADAATRTLSIALIDDLSAAQRERLVPVN
ncbi:hypothetical protein DM813_19330 [Pseudomonas alkylphenolica]|uniref:PEGA domain-containing protein n=2 Tax=Pseudomonas alkylphenolica TaxID=237609 RepID=A0A443ZRC8_9PSED|nr:hypothetical protein DM813_19330 [Pseudomonas alkylphenolica]